MSANGIKCIIPTFVIINCIQVDCSVLVTEAVHTGWRMPLYCIHDSLVWTTIDFRILPSVGVIISILPPPT